MTTTTTVPPASTFPYDDPMTLFKYMRQVLTLRTDDVEQRLLRVCCKATSLYLKHGWWLPNDVSVVKQITLLGLRGVMLYL